MKRILKDMNDHILKHPRKYLSLAVFCKVLLLGLFTVIGMQAIQNIYAQASDYKITIFTTLFLDALPKGEVIVPSGSDLEITYSSTNDKSGIGDILVRTKRDTHYGLVKSINLEKISENMEVSASERSVPQIEAIQVNCKDLNTITLSFDTNIRTIDDGAGGANVNSTNNVIGRKADGTKNVVVDLASNLKNGNNTFNLLEGAKINAGVEKIGVLTLRDLSKEFIVDCNEGTTINAVDPCNGNDIPKCLGLPEMAQKFMNLNNTLIIGQRELIIDDSVGLTDDNRLLYILQQARGGLINISDTLRSLLLRRPPGREAYPGDVFY